MDIVNLYLSSNKIIYSPILPSEENEFISVEVNEGEHIEQSENILDENQFPIGTRIHFILDHSFISCRFFQLPNVRQSNIRQLLEFELANTLVKDRSEYLFDFNYQKTPDDQFRVVAFCIEQGLSEQLYQIGHQRKLEVHGIYSMTNLIDLVYRASKPEESNSMYIHFAENEAQFYVYCNHFLSGFATIQLPDIEKKELLTSIPSLKLLEDINIRLRIILLSKRKVDALHVAPSMRQLVQTNGNYQIKIREKTEEKTFSPYVLYQYLESEASDRVFRHKQRVNLLESHNPLLEEVRKNRKILIHSILLLFICLSVYLFNAGFYTVMLRQHNQNLRKDYNELLRVMPQEANRKNALVVLNDQVQKMRKLQKQKNEVFIRNYKISSFIQKLSRHKIQVSDLIIESLEIRDHLILMKGKTKNKSSFEKFKDLLTQDFGKKYTFSIRPIITRKRTVQFTIHLKIKKK